MRKSCLFRSWSDVINLARVKSSLWNACAAEETVARLVAAWILTLTALAACGPSAAPSTASDALGIPVKIGAWTVATHQMDWTADDISEFFEVAEGTAVTSRLARSEIDTGAARPLIVYWFQVVGASPGQMWAGAEAAIVPIPAARTPVQVDGWDLERFDGQDKARDPAWIAVRGDRLAYLPGGTFDQVAAVLAAAR